MKAFLVVGLAYGDEGKGATVDYLCRKHDAKLVVRFNGGAQCGHNIVTPEGTHHCFSQFGSGTLVPGVRTYLSSHVIVNPLALAREEEHLRSIGVTDAWERLTIARDCLVTNPFHVRMNRLREAARGQSRHGSCGMGIGETVAESLANEYPLRASELRDEPSVLIALSMTFARGVDAFGSSFGEATEIEEAAQRMVEAARPIQLGLRDKYIAARLARSPTIVFEGAQGVLLDEDYGFAPYTTWSKTTLANADELLRGIGCEVRRIGVLRWYMTRHGAGPLVTETGCDVNGDHNRTNEWQGPFRTGYLDLPALQYATERCPVDELALTCLDQISEWPVIVCTDYDPRFTVSAKRLRETTCRLVRCTTIEHLVGLIEERLGAPVTIMSYGPTANDRKDRTL